MEQTRTLLTLVMKQHYKDRPDVLEAANKIVQEYSVLDVANYEKTLSKLYQLLNGLPSDILLYYLSIVPMPEHMDSSSSLISSMKQVHSSSFLQSMRPILVQYLNDQVPPLAPLSKSKDNINQPGTSGQAQPGPTVFSFIDEQIRDSKCKKRKSTRQVVVKKSKVSSLAQLCLKQIHVPSYQKRYKQMKKQAWNIVRGTESHKDDVSQSFKVLRDVNKKLRWLKAINSGVVPIEMIEDEYGNSDVFYNEKHLKNDVTEDLCDISDTLKCSLQNFMKKCE